MLQCCSGGGRPLIDRQADRQPDSKIDGYLLIVSRRSGLLTRSDLQGRGLIQLREECTYEY